MTFKTPETTSTQAVNHQRNDVITQPVASESNTIHSRKTESENVQ